MVLQRLRRLHSNEGGNIAFLTVFGAVALVGLLGLLMTSGDQASQKIRMQNTADAAALSGGAWIARGLNLTSAANVIQSQLIGAAIVLQALEKTLQIAQPIVAGMCAGYTACSFTVACIPLAAVTCFQKSILPGVTAAVTTAVNTLARCPHGLFWQTARVLEILNAAVHYSFYGIAAAEAFAVGRANGADFTLLLPGPVFNGNPGNSFFLPTKRGNFPDLCDPMENGSPSADRRGYTKLLGYPVGQGPFALGRCRTSWAAAFVTGFPPVSPLLLPLIANAQKESLCVGGDTGPQTTEIERPAQDLAECRHLGGTALWRKTRVEIALYVQEIDSCSWFAARKGTHPYTDIPGLAVIDDQPVEYSCADPIPGRRIAEGLYCAHNFTHVIDDSSPQTYLHEMYIWTLERTSVPDKIEVEPPATSSCPQPRPYMLSDEPDALRYLVVAHRPNRRVFFSELFQEPPPDFYTYAQVEVYSGISDDTFNQDWRVHLERAALLERPFQRLGSGASGFLDDLLSIAGQLPLEIPDDTLASLTQGFLGDFFAPGTWNDVFSEETGEDSFRRLLTH